MIKILGTVVSLEDEPIPESLVVRIFDSTGRVSESRVSSEGLFNVEVVAAGQHLICFATSDPSVEYYHHHFLLPSEITQAPGHWLLMEKWIDPITGIDRLEQMLRHSPPSSGDTAWLWRSEDMPISLSVTGEIPDRIRQPVIDAAEAWNAAVPGLFRIVDIPISRGITLAVDPALFANEAANTGRLQFTRVTPTHPVHGELRVSAGLLPHVVRAIALHELGHATGYHGHSEDPHSVMADKLFAVSNDGTTVNELLARAQDLRAKNLDASVHALMSAYTVACHHANNGELASVLFAVGTTYIGMNEFKYSELCLSEADSLAFETSLRSAIADSLGGLMVMTNRFDEGVAQYRKAADLAAVARDVLGHAAALANLSDVYIRKKDLTTADEILANARSLLNRNDEKHSETLASLLFQQATIRFRIGDLEEAERLDREAFAIAKQFNLNRLAATIALGLGELSIKARRVLEALEWFGKSAVMWEAAGYKQRAIGVASGSYWFAKGVSNEEYRHYFIGELDRLLRSGNSASRFQLELLKEDFYEQNEDIEQLERIQRSISELAKRSVNDAIVAELLALRDTGRSYAIHCRAAVAEDKEIPLP